MHVFVPLEDPAALSATTPLVPYRCGLPFAFELEPAAPARADQRRIVSSSPGATPNARAWPALSSST